MRRSVEIFDGMLVVPTKSNRALQQERHKAAVKRLEAEGGLNLVREKSLRMGEKPDTGCNIAPKCLECPLPICKFDKRHLQKSMRRFF